MDEEEEENSVVAGEEDFVRLGDAVDEEEEENFLKSTPLVSSEIFGGATGSFMAL